MLKRFLVVLGFFTCVAAFGQTAPVAAPLVEWNSMQPVGHISDYAQVLSQKEQLDLDGLLQELQTQMGANLNFVTISSLQRYNIEEVTKRLYDLWGLGDANNNQAALMVLSADDGATHLYVGMGLRGVLNAQWTKDQFSRQLEPLLEARQFDRALVNSVTMIVKRVYTDRESQPLRSAPLVVTKNSAGVLQKVQVKGSNIAFAVVGGLILFFIISMFVGPKKDTSVYQTSQGFERDRAGPFGGKKPRWL